MPRGSLTHRLSELEKAAAAQGASFSSLTGMGGSSDAMTGTNLAVENPDWIWIKITEVPGGADEGYSWEEVSPLVNGSFDTTPNGLTGNNGSVAGDRYRVAYEINGSTTIPVDTIAQAWPAYFTSDSDPDGDEGQEYAFQVGGGTSTTTEICQPMHAGIADDVGDLELHYPSVFVRRDTAAGEWTEGPFMSGDYDCYLIQTGRQSSGGYPLTVTSDDGPGRYMAIKQVGTKTLTVDAVSTTLPVYATSDRPTLGPDCTVQN